MSSALFLGTLTLAAWTVGFIRPGYRAGAATAWGLMVLVYGLLWSGFQVRSLVARGKSPYDRVLQTPVYERMRPPDLVRCERIFGRKVYTPEDFDHTVRPLLRTLIRHRLALGGDVLDDAAHAPKETLDEELSGLIGRVPAETLYGRNLSTADFERMLHRIEATHDRGSGI
ncbi:MAG: hypothetical protein M3360_00010 [Actinomycetota bacterium]|nr:hypothetical protein [Actinomycetota bacterium]